VEPWSLTSLHEKLIKIDAVVCRGRYVTFQIAKGCGGGRCSQKSRR
jgi:hypothetical protein